MSGHTLDKLVYMANQIAREFGNQQPRQAADATWDHLWHFWDPRMRGMIVAHLRAGGEGLNDVAKAAVAKLAGDAEPEPVTRATEYTSPGEDEAEPMSDGG
ncbi:MAG TPA: formate dehydrogenase subunit delta [Allosphingosinicella sp.]|nr:formate dehydrogenase subunit delta [Allosphingosinicella sp.]